MIMNIKMELRRKNFKNKNEIKFWFGDQNGRSLMCEIAKIY